MPGIKNPRTPSVLLRPNGNTIALLAVLGAMWYTGASQNNGAAYALFVLVLALALVSAAHAWANVTGVAVEVVDFPPAYAGKPIILRVSVRFPAGKAPIALHLSCAGSVTPTEIPPAAGGAAAIELPPRHRGKYEELRLELSSTYPLGFFTARALLVLQHGHWVYPYPEGAPLPPVDRGDFASASPTETVEGDDFAGVRGYQPGESMRHIDWKAAARGQPLLIKQWARPAGDRHRFRWADLPDLPAETRLSQLAWWIILAQREGRGWELELPGTPIMEGQGDAHFHRALRALAEWPHEISVQS